MEKKTKITNKKEQKKLQFYIPTLYIWITSGALTIFAVFLGVSMFNESYTPKLSNDIPGDIPLADLPTGDDYYNYLRENSEGFDAELLQSLINE